MCFKFLSCRTIQFDCSLLLRVVILKHLKYPQLSRWRTEKRLLVWTLVLYRGWNKVLNDGHVFNKSFNRSHHNASSFSQQFNPWIKHKGHENKINDRKLKKLLILRQIHLASTMGNVEKTEGRSCVLMLRYKRLTSTLPGVIKIAFPYNCDKINTFLTRKMTKWKLRGGGG